MLISRRQFLIFGRRATGTFSIELWRDAHAHFFNGDRWRSFISEFAHLRRHFADFYALPFSR